jgi:hypothetical protein
MKMHVPRIQIHIYSAQSLEKVAECLSGKLFPGKGWHKSMTGRFEEVPALDLDELVLGMNLSLVEQAPAKLYTLFGEFDWSPAVFRGERYDEWDMSLPLSLLLQSVPAFTKVVVPEC